MADKNYPAGSTSAAMLPLIAGLILTLIWGAYTVLVVVEIATTPPPG